MDECSFGTKVHATIKILSKKQWKQKLRTESGLVINTCQLPVKIKFGHVNIDGRLSNWTCDFLFNKVFKSLKKRQSMKSLLLVLEGMLYQNSFDKKSDN